MAILYQFGKKITKEFDVLDFGRGVAIISGEYSPQERKIQTDDHLGMYVINNGGNKVHITDWDLKEHGLIIPEKEDEHHGTYGYYAGRLHSKK